MEVIVFILIIWVIVQYSTSQVVPPNSAVIVDRNTHYYKTFHSGQRYSLNSATDVVTTYISTSPVMQNYRNVFVTHDSKPFSVSFIVKYKAVDSINDVLEALQKSRRSIYDIVNTAVDTVISTYSSNEMTRTKDINDQLSQKIEYTLEPFNIEFIECKIITIINQPDPFISRRFQRHVSRSEGSSIESLESSRRYTNLTNDLSNPDMSTSGDPLDFKDDKKLFGVEYL